MKEIAQNRSTPEAYAAVGRARNTPQQNPETQQPVQPAPQPQAPAPAQTIIGAAIRQVSGLGDIPPGSQITITLSPS